ncbi:BrnT family toxin [Methyloglobulus sp.]|uniref:BrnT family toxin n=1 Tax=Methyloglobulus sp. TaxID=2518622 RepID=UPI00181824D8|nr:BrnT family toxin [Methyloglobulus sp.]
MNFSWDENKNQVNKSKHGISFETAKLVFDDPLHISVQDRHVNGEERWQTLGILNGVVVILVAHTTVEENNAEIVRIISARKATKHEVACYEKAH